MDFYSQILFFLAIVGAFNGLFLGLYFAFFTKHRNNANYFLSVLLFIIGAKIITFVLLYFDHNLFESVIAIGFSANALIGPSFYLYIKASRSDENTIDKYWWLHLVLGASFIPLISFLFPSTFNYSDGATRLSQYIAALIYFQWFIYLVFTALVLNESFKNVFRSRFKSNDEETWLVSLYIALCVFWLGPIITSRTTYMVGALSFSMIFYALFFLWIFKFRKTSGFFDRQVKYASKKIGSSDAEIISKELNQLFIEQELFRNPNLKVADVAVELHILPQRLSQFVNDNLGKSFSLLINEYRIDAAKEALVKNDKYTLEAIGYECGFNSKSTFYTTFKNLTGLTPASFKAQIESSSQP